LLSGRKLSKGVKTEVFARMFVHGDSQVAGLIGSQLKSGLPGCCGTSAVVVNAHLASAQCRLQELRR